MEYNRLFEVDLHQNINNRVFVKFMVLDAEVRLQKDKVTKYLKFTMCDSGVRVDACKFAATPQEIDALENGKVYQGAVDIKEYAKATNGISATVYNFEKINESSNDYAEWTHGIKEARDIIQEALNKIETPVYKKLACDIVLNRWKKFSTWAAASSIHHYALGGLMVHTAEVVKQSIEISTLWNEKYGSKFINTDLLLASALLHDVCKTDELDVDTVSGEVAYSTRASLETHITMCASLIDVVATKNNFGLATNDKSDEQIAIEQEQISLLKHCILAHHGKKEYGSPIEPHCPEAYILNIADGLSAEMFRYNKVFEELDKATSNTVWTCGQMVVTYKDNTK